MHIKNIQIEKLIPYHNNPRKDQAVDKVASSIREYGFQQPIVVDKDMILIVGHTRLQGAKKLGLKKVPVVIADLSEAKAKAYRIADNRLNEDSNWDMDLLGSEINELLEQDYNLDVLGFEDFEIEKFLNNEFDGLTEDDDIPIVPEIAISKLGDIYQLGNHKLICGDSTDEEVLSLLFKESKADMVFTDPPYNVDYGATKHPSWKQRSIMNDKMTEDEFEQFIESFILSSQKHIKEGSPYYICFGERNSLSFLSAFRKANLHHSCNIIWKKHSLVLGRSDYHYIHEPIFYGWLNGAKHKFYGDRTNTSVWEIDRPTISELHPTMKPIDLIAKALKNSSKSEDIIYDPFGGSGSTVIASEKLNRICYTIELDPKYVDVIVKRWENYTGSKAKKIN